MLTLNIRDSGLCIFKNLKILRQKKWIIKPHSKILERGNEAAVNESVLPLLPAEKPISWHAIQFFARKGHSTIWPPSSIKEHHICHQYQHRNFRNNERHLRFQKVSLSPFLLCTISSPWHHRCCHHRGSFLLLLMSIIIIRNQGRLQKVTGLTLPRIFCPTGKNATKGQIFDV